MNIFTVLPDFSTAPFANLLPSLERSEITVADLLTLDAIDVAKRAQIPVREARRLTEAVLTALHAQYGFASESAQSEIVPTTSVASDTRLFRSGQDLIEQWGTISTLDDSLDKALGGGIPTGYLTEITGESGVGKTQLLLTLLLAVQLGPPHGQRRSALYISTEAPLQTSRLTQMIQAHPHFTELAAEEKPTLSRILSIQTSDLEYQDHILRYQVPVAIKRDNIGLLVIDSITANYRAEFDRPGQNGHPAASMAKRSSQLMELGALLRDLARKEDIAVVVANQVADRFRTEQAPDSLMQRRVAPSSNPHNGQTGPGDPPTVAHHGPPSSEPADLRFAGQQTTPGLQSGFPDPLTLDHQQRWFSGWGDRSPSLDQLGLKTPSLGLVWTNQIACRIALHKRRIYRPSVIRDAGSAFQAEGSWWSRYLKVVFAPWVAAADGNSGVEFCIEKAGLKAVAGKEKQSYEQ